MINATSLRKFNNVKVWDLSTRCRESDILISQNAHEGREVSPETQIAPFSADYPPVVLGSIAD